MYQPCLFDGCGKPSRNRGKAGYCNGHRSQRGRGQELRPLGSYTTEDMLRAKLKRKAPEDPETGCWVWTGGVSTKGYPSVRHANVRHRTHRLAYQLWVEPLDEALVVHHVCANRLCINPNHLQAVTAQDNTAEMLERHKYQTEIAELRALLEACTCGVGEAA